MILSTPQFPFEHIFIAGPSITIDTNANCLILPTGTNSALTQFNEYCVGRSLTTGTYQFTDDPNVNTGLQNLTSPLIILISDSTIDFFLFQDRPKNLQCTINSSGKVSQLILYPGNGPVYHGQITYSNPLHDSNSDNIPDSLDLSKTGSVLKFLQNYDFQTVLIQTSDGMFITTSDGKTWEASR